MASTFTQNLGIECPATGEQANVWGVTVNRNFGTYDMAIKGNTTMSVSTSPVQLNVDNGVSNPQGAYPLIIWTGQQTGTPPGSVSITPTSRQSLYIMRNQTNGAIQFYQGNTSNNFLLQAGYDAIIYSDGGVGNPSGATTAQALGNPQFNNVLIEGSLQLNGSVVNNGLTVAGNLEVTSGYIGIGSPTSLPDPLTINGDGLVGQIRLIAGAYGVILRNDGQSFHIMVTAQNDPYGQYNGYAFYMSLATHNVGLAGSTPDPSYGLTVPSIHSGLVTLDTNLLAGGTITAGGVINGGAGIRITAGRSYFTNNETSPPAPYIIALDSDVNATHRTWIGTNTNGQFVVANAPGGLCFTVDQAGNGWLAAGLTVNGSLSVVSNISAASLSTTGNILAGGALSAGNGLTVTGGITASSWIHATAGGFQFPDGTTQSTAATTPPPATYSIQYVGLTIGSGNTYQNTGRGKALFISAWALVASGSNALSGYIGASSPGTLVAQAVSGSAGLTVHIFFIVPDGWYYQVTDTSGAAGSAISCAGWA